MVYLMFTSLWPLSALYFIWMVIDWRTPERGKPKNSLQSINENGRTPEPFSTLMCKSRGWSVLSVKCQNGVHSKTAPVFIKGIALWENINYTLIVTINCVDFGHSIDETYLE